MKAIFPIKVALLLALVVLKSIGLAHAAGTSANLTWTLATTFIDNTPIPAGSIKETLIEWRRPGSSTVVGSIRVAAPATSVTVQGLICGKYNITGTTVMNTSTLNSDPAAATPTPYDTAVVCRANPPGGLGAT